MPERITKVIYDVSEAIKNLNRLNDKVDESGKKSDNAFNKGGGAASKFNTLLGKIPGTAGRVASSVGKMALELGALGTFAAGAAVALGGLIAQFIDLPAFVRDSTATMDKFREATQRVLDTRNALSNIEDAASLAEAKRTTRSIRIRQAEADFKQTAVREAILNIQEEANAVKDSVREQNEAFKSAARTREQLEKRLESRQANRAGGGVADPDIQASTILDRAAEAARRGQVDLAEQLVDRAKQLQPELQNQAFFAGQLEDTEKAIDSSLEQQIAKAKEAEESSKSRLAQEQSVLENYQNQLDVLNRQAKVLSNLKTQLGGELRIAREESRRDVAARGRDEAVRGIEKVAADLRREIIDGGRSAAENIRDSFLQSTNNLKKAGISEAGQQTISEGLNALRNFGPLISRLEQGTATFGDIKRFVDQNALQVSEAVGALQVVVEREGLRGFQPDVDRLSRLNDSILDLSRFLEQAVTNDAAFTQTVQQGQQSTFDEFNRQQGGGSEADQRLQELASTALDTSGALEHVKEGAESFLSGLTGGTAAGASPVASPTPIPSASPINAEFNVNVKGGLIDREVTENILDIVRREVRKLTSEGLQ